MINYFILLEYKNKYIFMYFFFYTGIYSLSYKMDLSNFNEILWHIMDILIAKMLMLFILDLKPITKIYENTKNTLSWNEIIQKNGNLCDLLQ